MPHPQLWLFDDLPQPSRKALLTQWEVDTPTRWVADEIGGTLDVDGETFGRAILLSDEAAQAQAVEYIGLSAEEWEIINKLNNNEL